MTMSTVTINGEKVSTELEPEDWFEYRADAFKRLRKAPVAIDDLRALVDHAVGVAAYAIIRGSSWDEKTEAALEAAKRDIIDELSGNKGNEADWPGYEQYCVERTKEMERRTAGMPTDEEIARDFYHVGPPAQVPPYAPATKTEKPAARLRVVDDDFAF